MNSLTVALDRECVFTLDAVQSDNLTPLTITVESDLISTFGANPLLWVDFKLSDSTELYIGSYAPATSIVTTIPNSVLACAGILYAQIRIQDDAGVVWHSSQSYQFLSESIADSDPATVDDREYVQTPATYVSGNICTYDETSGRLVDTGESATDVVAVVQAENGRVIAEQARAVWEAYDNATEYVVGNKVYYLGSSYICILDSTGNLPTDTTHWQTIAQKGEQGEQGIPGEVQLSDIGNRTYTEQNYVTNGETLTESIDAIDTMVASHLAQKANQNDVNNSLALKSDKTYVDSNISTLDTKINSQASGSPKGTYATLADLQTAFSTGNTNIYLVTADGKWYFWNGSAWTAGGVYQGTSNPKLDANIVSLNNEIPNGNFANTQYWAPVAGTISVANNEATYTLTGVSATARLDYTLKNSVVDHIYYLVGEINPKYATPTTLRFGMSALFTNPTANVWNKIAIQAKATTSDILRFYHDTSAYYVVGDTVKFRNIMAIDLTAIFGAGKEPTKEDFEKLLATLPIWWKDIYNPSQVTMWNWEQLLIDDKITQSVAKPLTTKKLLTLGDSNSANGYWQQKVAEITGATIVNDSFAGAKYSITNNPTYDPHSFYTLSSTVDLTGIWGAFIMFGTNDYNNSLPLGVATDKVSTTVKGALYAGLENLFTRKPDLKVFIASPIWSGTITDTKLEDCHTNPNNLGLYLRDYIQAIEEVCKLFGVPFYHSMDNGGINKLNYTTYYNDYIHLNQNVGHPMMGTKWANFIKQHV